MYKQINKNSIRESYSFNCILRPPTVPISSAHPQMIEKDDLYNIPSKCTSLSISAWGKSIGDAEATAIAESLKGDTVLTFLNLRQNNIGVAGAEKIADMLKVNTTIKHLWIHANNIGYAGARKIADALRDCNRTLISLKYYNDGITSALYDEIDGYITRNNNLSSSERNKIYCELQEDGSILVNGCTDNTASNYNENADKDDGSCEYIGCTDDTMFNYDKFAKEKDNSCVPIVVCDKYNEYETIPYIPKISNRECSPLTVCNPTNKYESAPPTETTDRECAELTICNDNQYEKKPPTATTDRVCSPITECGNKLELKPPTETTDRVCHSTCEVGQYIQDDSCINLTECTDDKVPYDNGLYNDRYCLPNCDSDEYADADPPFPTRVSLLEKDDDLISLAPERAFTCKKLTICGEDENESQLFPPTEVYDRTCDCKDSSETNLGCGCGEDGPSGCDNVCGSTLELDECGVCGGDGQSCRGCTDDTMFNYDENANTDDGSCEAVVNGCTDDTMFNYDENANTDDGSCEAVVNGCTDETAFNYYNEANTDDGSCTYTSVLPQTGQDTQTATPAVDSLDSITIGTDINDDKKIIIDFGDDNTNNIFEKDIKIGDEIVFSPGTDKEERRTVVGKGSIILDRPLEYYHSTIKVIKGPGKKKNNLGIIIGGGVGGVVLIGLIIFLIIYLRRI
jgi:hypothetical protein